MSHNKEYGAFRKSDGNGGSIWDKTRIKEIVVSGLIIAFVTATINWCVNDRGTVMKNIRLISETQENVVTSLNNMSRAFYISHNLPCPDPVTVPKYEIK
jgi:hypothetical protein